jgi:hypothetical protein
MVQQSATFQLGVPAAVETAFMVEGTWNRILPSAEGHFRQTLDKLDKLECEILESDEDLRAKKMGDIELNDKLFEQLLQRYRHWQGQLANMLQIAPNPFDQRPGLGQGYGGGGPMNVPVQG